MRLFDTNERRRVRSASGQLSHSNPHLDCPVCEATRQLVMLTPIRPELTFSQAFPLWLEARVKISDQTRSDYIRYAKQAAKFFGDTPLNKIHPGMLVQYQRERLATAGPGVINKEIGTLLQVRRRACIEDKLEDLYEALELPYWSPPKTISDDKEKDFLLALRSKPEWDMAYNYALLSLRTGATGCELRGLKVADIDLDTAFMWIRREHVKNKYRVRKIPLVREAHIAAHRLLEIAAQKGSVAPYHYLLPIRIGTGMYDPMKPASRSLIRKPWAAARILANCPDFTPHGARHQVNTRLYESGADDMTIQSMMGHQSRQMSEHYSSIRDERKRAAVEAAFESPAKFRARGTNSY